MNLLTLLAQVPGAAPGDPVVPDLGAAVTTGGTAEFVVFVLAGALALGAGIAMVLLRNPVHAALMLVLNFFAIAVLYAVMEAQFLAIIQIIVYAGAIMVLFLFVLMLLGVRRYDPGGGRIRGQAPAAVALGLLLFVGLGFAVAEPYMQEGSVCGVTATPGTDSPPGEPCIGLAAANEAAQGNVAGVGRLLFTKYVWPFEVTSVLLVIAALGAMVLGRKDEDPADLVDVYLAEEDDEPPVAEAQLEVDDDDDDESDDDESDDDDDESDDDDTEQERV